MTKTKKNIKVRDLKPAKDAKGGHHSGPPKHINTGGSGTNHGHRHNIN